MMRSRVTFTICLGVTASAAVGVDPRDPANFVNQVISYQQGVGIPSDSITAQPFNDPGAALGPPTIDTTGDGFHTGSPFEPVPVVPLGPAFRRTELVAIGMGGQLVVRFANPVQNDRRNPGGIDLIIFGNSALLAGSGGWTNGDPNLTTTSGTLFAEGGIVSVSQDAQTWATFSNGPVADGFAPTLGRRYDPTNPDPTLGTWNLWWSDSTNPTWPLNPLLAPADFADFTLTQIANAYVQNTAGGTGFDLAELDLDWIQYVRIENTANSGLTPEIDAIADVLPAGIVADLDCDGDVDMDDFGVFQSCSTGPALGPPDPGCHRADFDNDEDVDHSDFARFQVCASGPGATALSTCMDAFPE